MPGGRPRVFTERRLADYPPPTPQPTPCRLWQGAVHSSGYGVLVGFSHQSNKKKHYAHRWVWEAVNGPIPPRLVVRHKCDNRLCYRLSHLELGTQADNVADAVQRGHAGPTLVLSPSQIKVLFDLRDEGLSYREVHEFFPEVSIATIKRIGLLGREAFGDLWDPEATGWFKPNQNPALTKASERYASWRERGPS
jgi:HNH endonuclease